MVSDIEGQLRMIVECLDRHRVSYVVIGGVAAMLQDVAIQETVDVDVVPRRETKTSYSSLASDRSTSPSNPRGLRCTPIWSGGPWCCDASIAR